MTTFHYLPGTTDVIGIIIIIIMNVITDSLV